MQNQDAGTIKDFNRDEEFMMTRGAQTDNFIYLDSVNYEEEMEEDVANGKYLGG